MSATVTPRYDDLMSTEINRRDLTAWQSAVHTVETELATARAEADRLREALSHILNYPKLREYIGSQLADAADAALRLPEKVGEPVAWESQRFDCNYDGDISRCDKDCAQIGACKRRTNASGKAVENFPASLRSPFNACMLKEQCIQQAEKVAAPPSQPAQGWKLVPVEPTPEMLKAGYPPDSEEAQSWGIAEVYRAMLAAAPAAPTSPLDASEGEIGQHQAREILGYMHRGEEG